MLDSDRASTASQGGVLIAVPCLDMVPVDFMTSMINLRKTANTRYAVVQNSLIYDARNTLTATALRAEGGYSRVLWVDSDMVFQPDALQRLCATMDETGAGVVSGLCFKRRLPTSPVIYSAVEHEVSEEGINVKATIMRDYVPESVFDVAGCGFGLCLTSVDALRAVWEKYGPPFDPMTQMGEDLSFCWRCGMLGIRMVCDTRVKAGHVGRMIYDEDVYAKQRVSEIGDAEA